MKTILTIILFLFSCGNIFSQGNEVLRKKFSEAEAFYKAENYTKAFSSYWEIYQTDTTNANLNFKIALCLLNDPFTIVKSVSFFQSALSDIAEKTQYNPDIFKSRKSPFETPFYLAQALHRNYNFDQALQILSDFSQITQEDSILHSKVTLLFNQCNNAFDLLPIPVNMKVSSVGVPMNSEYADFSPVIAPDESFVIFTSGRKPLGKGIQTDNDIFISIKEKSDWSDAKSLGLNINSSGNEISAGISPDGKQLFICKKDVSEWNLYVSTYDNKNWSKIKKLNASINSKFDERDVSLSPDGMILYFSSNRPEGFGGYDIYMSRKLPNGEWAMPVNLGNTINTPYDDVSPYIAHDGNTLFFSSEGHTSTGGLDIFFATAKDENNWDTPLNIGYPVNTPFDDQYYKPTADGKRAYYSSWVKEGVGDIDICQITTISNVKPFAILSGFVKTEETESAINAEITVFESEPMELIGKYIANAKTGKFLIVVAPRKNYVLTCISDKHLPVVTTISTTRKANFLETENTVKIDTLVLKKEFDSIFFDFIPEDTSMVTKHETKLKIFTDFIKEYNLLMEILSDNSELAEQRIKHLINYFTVNGVIKNRISNKFKCPISDKNTIAIVFYTQKFTNKIESFLGQKGCSVK
ncbi:MAG: hypothetical protein A2275_18995 [Bacteroidetes bacterium RIFOXYA12_FULL_35_11]|nr:MAG: hypothetical protein A2X01_18345 [Bacteroidetes bacterium GWF2_35_48]OFY80417.1 MAG: hypothetical protein A2275_18995 [Bacteroidetes bacterium RIFOXYA12_FULL_35_11]OFY92660.1 MAG: hypothetical protein A2309_06780 [Bacteroidetes bacterium RIFOXYB2_FULL_35_7]HBX52434.1 hypothetical protein [Bacteroidales bacterium]